LALKLEGKLPDRPVRVLGDSQLIMRFMLRIYRQPRKPFLYQKVEEVRQLVKRLGLKVAYRHVPRRLNSVPDAMCRLALAAAENVRYI
jgi:riboflavin biosynthesis pyrimidine reductase